MEGSLPDPPSPAPYSVQDLIDHPLLQHTRPEVVAGEDLASRPVRWVHTSEIFDISPLLKGGEVLLTTGLGLVGAGPAATAEYVRSLARKRVSALLLELGRTFTAPPPALLTTAREEGLPLVLLHGVVPFIEITEAVHPVLVSGEIEELRRVERAARVLHQAAQSDADVTELLALIGELCGAAVGLYTVDGDLLAGADVGAPSARPGSGAAPGRLEVDVGEAWAVLVLVRTDGPVDGRIGELAAGVVHLRLGTARRHGRVAGTDLVRSLATRTYVSSSDIATHARAAGFVPAPDTHVLGIAVEIRALSSVRPALALTARTARQHLGSTLVAEVEGEFLLAAAVRPLDLRGRLGDFTDALEEELRSTVGSDMVRVAAGPLAEDVAGLARSLPLARETLRLAERVTPGSRTVLASELGVYRLLSSVVADDDLETFVREQLGPLLEHDAGHGSELVATLDAYLEAGLSKTLAARSLGVRRQTLYGRLERISRLLGELDLRSRQARTALDLALVSWRMRSSAAGRRT